MDSVKMYGQRSVGGMRLCLHNLQLVTVQKDQTVMQMQSRSRDSRSRGDAGANERLFMLSQDNQPPPIDDLSAVQYVKGFHPLH